MLPDSGLRLLVRISTDELPKKPHTAQTTRQHVGLPPSVAKTTGRPFRDKPGVQRDHKQDTPLARMISVDQPYLSSESLSILTHGQQVTSR